MSTSFGGSQIRATFEGSLPLNESDFNKNKKKIQKNILAISVVFVRNR